MFDLHSCMAIKTIEQSVCIDENDTTLQLFKPEDIIRLKNVKKANQYKYLHIGCIQVAFKPLTLLGLNTSLMTQLRDARCLDYKPSLMGIVETSHSQGPVFFNVYPNLTLSLTDGDLCEVATLRLHTHVYNFLLGSETLAIIYRIHYKVMNTLAPNVHQKSSPGKTVLI